MQIGPAAAARVALLTGLIVFIAAPSRALPFLPVTTLEIYENNVLQTTLNTAALNCANTGVGLAHCQIFGVQVGDLYIGGLGINLFEDPQIETSFGVENSSGSTQQFTLVFTMSAASIPGATLTGGSTAFDFSENTGDGGSLQAPTGSALYTALIDGAAYQTLFPDPTSFPVFAPFDGGPLGATDFGTPIPSQSGPAVTTSIGIKYDFTLTGGNDATSSTGKFVVKAVPEPTPALLVAFGLAMLAAAARRR